MFLRSCRMLSCIGIEPGVQHKAIDLDRTGIVCRFFDHRAHLSEHRRQVQKIKTSAKISFLDLVLYQQLIEAAVLLSNRTVCGFDARMKKKEITRN